jgi:hypothetical protein
MTVVISLVMELKKISPGFARHFVMSSYYIYSNFVCDTHASFVCFKSLVSRLHKLNGKNGA